MVKRIAKSFHGRILLISLMGTILCVLSCGMVFQITIRTVGQNQLADAMNANLDKEMEHLEFCYFTMARMMQQMGENGNIGGMVQDYLDACKGTVALSDRYAENVGGDGGRLPL